MNMKKCDLIIVKNIVARPFADNTTEPFVSKQVGPFVENKIISFMFWTVTTENFQHRVLILLSGSVTVIYYFQKNEGQI